MDTQKEGVVCLDHDAPTNPVIAVISQKFRILNQRMPSFVFVSYIRIRNVYVIELKSFLFHASPLYSRESRQSLHIS